MICFLEEIMNHLQTVLRNPIFYQLKKNPVDDLKTTIIIILNDLTLKYYQYSAFFLLITHAGWLFSKIKSG